MSERAVLRPGSIRRAVAILVGKRVVLACLAVLGVLALVAVFADEIASDLPVVCRVHGTLYVMPNVTRPAALEGYDHARIARERQAGDWAFGPLMRQGPQQESHDVLAPPLRELGHPLGTDELGRDVLVRLVYGARVTLGVALLAVVGFVLVGAVLGALSGFFGGGLDFLVARLTETLSSFPVPVLVLAVQAMVPRPGVGSLLTTIAVLRWPEVARLVRAEVMAVASSDYVVAARALGATPARVLRRHVLPMALTPAVVTAVLGLGQIVLLESSLDFLRVGLPASVPTWGEMLSESRDHFGAWWLLLLPGLLVFLTVIATNAVGEAARDALDPRV